MKVKQKEKNEKNRRIEIKKGYKEKQIKQKGKDGNKMSD